jgi:hypothetical protein
MKATRPQRQSRCRTGSPRVHSCHHTCKLKFAHERGFRDMHGKNARPQQRNTTIREQRPHTKRPPGRSAAAHHNQLNQLEPPYLVTRQPGPQVAAHVMFRLISKAYAFMSTRVHARSWTATSGNQKSSRIGQSKQDRRAGNPIPLIMLSMSLVRKCRAQKPGRRRRRRTQGYDTRTPSAVMAAGQESTG